MKKLIAVLLALALVAAMAACSPAPQEEAAPAETKPPFEVAPVQKVIHVVLPGAQEGWNAAAAAEAMLGVEELLAEGAFAVETAQYTTPQEQVALLEQIAKSGNGDGSLAVVTMPAAKDMDEVFAKLLEANVAYALAETIPAGAESASVANVYYDQYAIGAAMAAWMVEKGLTQDSGVVIVQGSTEQEAMRTEGFQQYLLGALDHNGAVIETPWTSTESIVYSEMEGETRESAEAYFTAYLEEKAHASTGYLVAWEDAYLLGILDALESEGMNADNKNRFLEGAPFLGSCGGSKEVMDVLTGDSRYSSIQALGGIQTVQYDPALLNIALRSMADHLAGNVVEQDQPQSIVWITGENAAEFAGY